MIHSLSIRNFRSFKNEVILSFEATKDKNHKNYHVVEVAPGVNLLKLGIVLGANASGKSNLLKVFEFLKDFWVHSPESKIDGTSAIPFLLDKKKPKQPTIIRLIFFVNKQKYNYNLEINSEYVLSESLTFYPTVQPALIFERKLNNNVSEIEFGKKIKISQIGRDEIAIKCLPNMSVLTSYGQVNINIPEIESVLHWMRIQFMNIVDPDMRLVEYAENVVLKEKEMKEKMLAYLQEADFNISDMLLHDVERKLPDFVIDSLARDKNIPPDEIERIKKEKTIHVKEVEFSHKIFNKGLEELYELPKELQSAGTLRIFGLSTILMKAIKNNAFLAIDEIESKLHPRLIEFVLEKFLRESKESQLLVATHYDGLLEADNLLRKDNFWFTEKKEDGSTSLFSLADFPAVNRITSWQKAYKYGKFGATPQIDNRNGRSA